MKTRIIALIGAIVMLASFFTACGNGGSQGGNKPQKNEPQLVIAANPVFVYDDDSYSLAYNEINQAMAADNQSSSLTAITDTAWTWTYDAGDGWVQRAVYGFGRWQNGSAAQAKGVFSYRFSETGSTSAAVYDVRKNELAPYQGETLPETGLLLSATAGAEEALRYTVKQDGELTIPAGTFTAIEQVAGVKTGFLAEDGTARSASVRIIVNSAQVYSGTLSNSSAAADGAAVTQLSYPEIADIPVKAGDAVIIALKLDAAANSDEDVTAPTVNEEDNWQVVRKSTQVLVEKEELKESDVMTADGAYKTISNFQFTFTLVRDDAHIATVTEMAKTIMKRTGGEVFSSRPEKEAKYEIVIGVVKERPESEKIYKEIVSARVDNATDFILRMIGTKLYIVGANDGALQEAINFFLETFVKDDKGAIPAKYNYYNKPKHVVYTIAGQNIATYTLRTERYPSHVVKMAAEAIQKSVLEDCGLNIPIKPMNLEGTDLGNNEIRIGPMNGAVHIDRQYDTRFNSGNWQNIMTIEDDGMLKTDEGDWKVYFDGKNVVVEGGSAYAVNVGTTKMFADLKKAKSIDTSYKASGNYTSYYDWKTMYEYEKVDFSMADGYGLVYEENWNYTGNSKQIEREVLKTWNVSTKTDAPDISREMVTYHPHVYGENWWIAADTYGNGYLFETTRKRTLEHEGTDEGWEGVRLLTDGKMGFRYGIWESRMIMGCRNGACSSMWGVADPPYDRVGAYFEIDVYENYGREIFVPCTHYSENGVLLGNYHFQPPYYQEACWFGPNEGEHFYDTFHHVCIDWTYDRLDVYFDGECVSAMPMFNYEEFKYFRYGIVPRFALTPGGLNYNAIQPNDYTGERISYVPKYWMGEENVHKFYELQLVDYTRIHQFSNENITNPQAEAEMRFTATYGR